MSARQVVVALAVSLSGMAAAATSHAYDPLTWRSLDSGGAAFVTGGGYALGGTIGQPDAGRLASGALALNGGFWFGGQVQVNGVGDDTPPAFAFRFFRTPNPVRSRSRAATRSEARSASPTPAASRAERSRSAAGSGSVDRSR